MQERDRRLDVAYVRQDQGCKVDILDDILDSMDNNKVSNKESTTNYNTSCNNMKDNNKSSMDSRNRILPIRCKDNLLQRKHLCYSHHRRHRSNSRSYLRDNRIRFYNCRRSMSRCWYKPRRWCRSQFQFFRM